MENILFISDLHLEPEREDVTATFLDFLDHEARDAEALYILGDLFEIWVGDDQQTPLNSRVLDALRAVSERGTSVYIMHGNRDFLLGERFCHAAGAELVDEPQALSLGGHRVLLMHGDTLCTRDEDYQAFRAQVRQPDWIQGFLAKPLEEREAIARQIRGQAQTEASIKPEAIMDVTEDEVQRVMAEYETPLLIHGHTHRPNVHEVSLDQGSGERMVLGAWHEQAWYIRLSGGTFELVSRPLSPVPGQD